MKSKIGRNEICPCGSGLKFKKCCFLKDKEKPAFNNQKEWNDWCEIVSKLPFRAEITSENGSEHSMKVTSAKIIRNGNEEILFEDEIELKTNTIVGDKFEHSKAIFIVPQNNKEPIIKTIGNASVSNNNFINNISIEGNHKKLKVKSISGLFASTKIGLQRDTQQKYFQLFFGVEGKEEKIESSGMKDRPHIDFFPNANGKFIRLSSYKCQLDFNSGYDKINKIIYPSFVNILIEDYNENLEIEFKYENNVAILCDMKFKKA